MGGEPVYAGFLRRAVAAAIDVVIAGLLVVGVAAIPIARSAPSSHGTGVMFLHPNWLLLVPLIVLFVPAAYGTVFVARYGGTPGKLLLGMRVVTEALAPVGVGRAFARHLLSWFSVLTLFLGYLSAPFDRRRRTLHDQLAGTVVILAGRDEVAGTWVEDPAFDDAIREIDSVDPDLWS